MKCTKCQLYKTSCVGTKSHVKFEGEGNSNADIMFVGDVIGFNDILENKLFAGKAGTILSAALMNLNIKKEDIYLTTLVKCKPEQSKAPTIKETNICTRYLDDEIKDIKPKVICALGGAATEYFLNERGITKLRGGSKWNDKYNCWVVPMYHPSYLLRFSKYSQVFKDFYKDISLAVSLTTGTKKEIITKCSVANTIEKVKKVKKYLLNKKEFAFDTETTSLDPQLSKVICASFSSKEGEGIVIPFQDERIFNEEEQKEVKKQLQEILGSSCLKIAQNGKFDIKQLLIRGIEVNTFYFDTIIAHHLIDENLKHDLSFLTSIYTTMKSYKDGLKDYIVGNIKIAFEKEVKQNTLVPVTKTCNRKSTILDAPLDELYEYAAKDADATLRVYKKLDVVLKEQKLNNLFYKVVIPVVPILAKMELDGIGVDKEYLEKANTQFMYKIKMLEKELLDNKDIKDYCAKRELKVFNFNSPKQLTELLFDDMNLKPVKFTDKNNASTDKESLETLAKKYKNKFLNTIVSYRKLQKFHKTYIAAYLKLGLASLDNKIHTNYKLHGTTTGRFSSSNPNLQNIPKRGGGDKLIRKCFVARKGYTFLEADYSQLEFRIFAHYSNDKELIKIAGEEDIHATIAAKIFNLSLDKVSKEQRSMAKAAVFGGIMYGGGPSIIVNKFGVSFQRAERIINEFFDNFPTAYKYIVEQKKFVKETEYVINLFNRRRRLDGVHSNVAGIRKASLRQAINAPIQGGGADVVLLAMQKVSKVIKDIDCNLLLNIHDSLIFEINDNILKETVLRIKEVMERPVKLKVPLVVTIELGINLGEMKEINY